MQEAHTMEGRLTPAEMREVERHKWLLSEECGCDVGMDHATQDWLENHAQQWRQQRQAHMLEMQRREIERYKWIESEKAQRDLGRDAALDWIGQYAARWRDWYEKEYNDAGGSGQRGEATA